jgi:tetratricopeptide (TPR) repeat protein
MDFRFCETLVKKHLPIASGLILAGLLLATSASSGQNDDAVYQPSPGAIKSDDSDKAIADCTQAIQANPQDKQAYFRRAFAYMQENENDQAISDLNRVLQIDPGFAQGYFRRAFVYMLKDEEDPALADLSQAIQISPKYAWAYFRRAYVYMIKHDYDQAVADLNQVIQIDPNFTRAYSRRDYVYQLKGDYGQVIADLNQTIQSNPKDAGTYNHLAWLLATCPEAGSRNGIQAVQSATTACQLTSWQAPAYLDTLAAAEAEAGDFNDAVKWENEALSTPSSDVISTGRKNRLALYQSHQPYHVVQYDPHFEIIVN